MGQDPCNGSPRREEGRGTAVFLKIMAENFSKFDEKDLCAFPKRSMNPKHDKYSHSRVKLVQATEKNLKRQQETVSIEGELRCCRWLTAHQWGPEGSGRA